MASIRYFYLILLCAIASSGQLFADDSHSKSLQVTGKAKVIGPISIVNTDGQGLDFGMIAAGSMESIIIVSAESPVPVKVYTGDAVILTSIPQKAAKFTVFGEVGQSYSITLSSSAILNAGSNTLSVDNFTCSNGTDGNIGTNDLFYVGGELTIPSGSVPGIYQGTFTVTVSYN